MGGQAQDSGGGLLGTALSIGQISMRIYPVKDIMAFEFKPLKGITVGHFQILTPATIEVNPFFPFCFVLFVLR
jgi:hypothetical protein